jgi:hypothetical protein
VVIHTADSKAVSGDKSHIGERRMQRKRGFLMMTKQEARKYFGLGDNDRIDREGILRLQKNAEKQLKVWSLTQFHREKLENEIEALEVLLGE